MVVSVNRKSLDLLKGLPACHAPYSDTEINTWLHGYKHTIPTLSIRDVDEQYVNQLQLDYETVLFSREQHPIVPLATLSPEVVSTVSKLVQQVRPAINEDDKTRELEIRVGRFDASGFSPGYTSHHKTIVRHLLGALRTSVAVDGGTWSYVGKCVYVRYLYAGGLRRTTVKGGGTQITHKTVDARADLYCRSRDYDLRVGLATEASTDSTLKDLPKKAYREHLVERESFREHVPGAVPLVFQYDISKATRNLSNSPYICDYHVEVELVTTLPPSRGTAEDMALDRRVAKLLLTRGVTLLGTYAQTPTGTRLLPGAVLSTTNPVYSRLMVDGNDRF
jgi:hypothetical protein